MTHMAVQEHHEEMAADQVENITYEQF